MLDLDDGSLKNACKNEYRETSTYEQSKWRMGKSDIWSIHNIDTMRRCTWVCWACVMIVAVPKPGRRREAR